MDAYFAAVFIPNTLFTVLIAGTLSPIFIPILLAESGTDDRERISEIFSNVTNFLFVLLLLSVSVGLLTLRLWLPALFSGFSASTMQLTIRLTYIVLPGVLFLAVSGILTALLNGFHRFALAAFSPALSSVVVIVAITLARGNEAIYVVAMATLIGCVIQSLVLIPATKPLGIRYRPVLNLRHHSIRKLLQLGIPLFLYLAIGNASLLVERTLASHVSTGAIAVLSYALRLFMVPVSFIAVPLATVVYPQFAREAASQDYGSLRSHLLKIFRITVFIFSPITVLMVLNALPITRLLYEHGKFRPEDSLATSHVLAVFGTAIIPYAISVIGLRCYFALKDTVTPMLAELVNLAFYFGPARVLAHHYGLIGLAISRVSVFFLVGIILLVLLLKRLGFVNITGGIVGFLGRTAIACTVMGIVNWILLQWIHASFDAAGTPLRLGIVLLLLVLSGAAFLGVATLLRIKEAAYCTRIVLGFMRPSCEVQTR